MSRTYKDRPNRIRYEPWDKDRIMVIPGTWHYMYLPTTKTKKRKEVDTEQYWYPTPGWWTRLMMNRPQRRAGTLWEQEVVRTGIQELDNLDTPSVSRKPHVYYW